MAREARGALGVAGVERRDRERPAARVAADVVEGQQPRVAVEGGVLDALGHDRRRRLLEARDERGRRAREPLLQPRLAQHREVRRLRRPADVGAVDGQRRERRLESLDPRPVAPQAVGVGRERRARLLLLGLVRPRAERPRVAGELLPQRGQRRLARGIDEQRRDVVEELVADRALDRPVAQRLAGIEDLLHPHVRGAAVAEPLEVAGRVGQAVGMVDPQPVDQALAHERQGEPVRLGEHGRILLAHAGQVVDVEEAAVPAGRRVEVEEARAPLGVAPVRVRVVGRHVVRDDVEHDPEARVARRGRERAQAGLAAQRVGDPGRVDHVVAVRRALARGERRGQVQVRDAEVAQVGHERLGARERQVRPELQPVGRAERRHVNRCVAAAAASAPSGAAPPGPTRSPPPPRRPARPCRAGPTSARRSAAWAGGSRRRRPRR